MRTQDGKPLMASSRRNARSTRQRAGWILLALWMGSSGCCTQPTVPQDYRPLLPPGEPPDMTVVLDARARLWGVSPPQPAKPEDAPPDWTPAGAGWKATAIVVPIPDMELLLADRARLRAYVRALMLAGNWRTLEEGQ